MEQKFDQAKQNATNRIFILILSVLSLIAGVLVLVSKIAAFVAGGG